MNVEKRPIVAKFGGSSLANAERIKRVKDIVEADSARKFIVVSAPGKGDPKNPLEQDKCTDLLIARDADTYKKRVREIGKETGINTDNLLAEVDEAIESDNEDLVKSRGEWVMAKMVAKYIGAKFVDAADIIDFATYTADVAHLSDRGTYVIPGFYGTDRTTGAVRCFKRGGSDITGAIIAKAVGARIYENWTDTDGVKTADPRIVDDAKTIYKITYEEMEGLAYRGAEVLQMNSVRPVRHARIPIQVRNTFNPDHQGTRIVEQRISTKDESILGIASKEDFVSFQIGKPGMNEQLGAIKQIAGIFADNGISVEQGPGEMDSLSFICDAEKLKNGKVEDVMTQLHEEFEPETLDIVDDIGLIAVVGQKIRKNATDINAALYSALKDAHIRTGAHIQPQAGTSIVFSVENRDVTRTVETLYDAFIR